MEAVGVWFRVSARCYNQPCPPRGETHNTVNHQMNDVAEHKTRFRLTRLFWIGLVVLCLGIGPLLTVIILAKFGVTSDPNPNPILPGIIAMFTFWPGVVAALWGLIESWIRYRREKRSAMLPPAKLN